MTSAFSEALSETARARSGPVCGMRSILEKLDEASRRDVEAAVEDRQRWSSPQIQAALDKMGHTISEWTIGKHRRHRCGCFR